MRNPEGIKHQGYTKPMPLLLLGLYPCRPIQRHGLVHLHQNRQSQVRHGMKRAIELEVEKVGYLVIHL